MLLILSNLMIVAVIFILMCVVIIFHIIDYDNEFKSVTLIIGLLLILSILYKVYL